MSLGFGICNEGLILGLNIELRTQINVLGILDSRVCRGAAFVIAHTGFACIGNKGAKLLNLG